MKILPIATNHIEITLETGKVIDINDGGKDGMRITVTNKSDHIDTIRTSDIGSIILVVKGKKDPW